MTRLRVMLAPAYEMSDADDTQVLFVPFYHFPPFCVLFSMLCVLTSAELHLLVTNLTSDTLSFLLCHIVWSSYEIDYDTGIHRKGILGYIPTPEIFYIRFKVYIGGAYILGGRLISPLKKIPGYATGLWNHEIDYLLYCDFFQTS
jgi:hypothetical protein